MRPAEVLDVRAKVVDYLLSAPFHAELGRGRVLRPAPGTSTAQAEMEVGERLATKMRTSLKASEAFHVQADMVSLLLVASADLEDDDHLIHERLPTEQGFLLFDRPVPKPLPFDKGVRQSSIHGLSWSVGSSGSHPGTIRKNHPGIWVDTWINVDDPNNEVWAEMNRERPGWRDNWVAHLGTWWPSERFHLGFGDPVGPTEVTQKQYAALLGDMHMANGDASDETPVLNQARLVVALFRLLNQVIVTTSMSDVDRATARRSERKDLSSTVRTVALRRRTTDQTKQPSAQVEWHHSWLVRGHWAWRACGREHQYAEEYDKGWHARVYIAPYVKGPEDKPLQVMEKVWDLSR